MQEVVKARENKQKAKPKPKVKAMKVKAIKKKKNDYLITTCNKCKRTYDCYHFDHECRLKTNRQGKQYLYRREWPKRSLIHFESKEVELPVSNPLDTIELVN